MLGKALRLRRVFANGRALIVDCDPLSDDPLGRVRALARAGVDAVVVTPGLLDVVAEELAALSVILRIDGGMHRAQQLISVQAALEMGAEAVLVSVAVRGPGPSENLERFWRVTEDARRLGMPVFAEMTGENWLELARLGADYGADVILARMVPDRSSYRHFQRMTGRPFVAVLGDDERAGPNLLNSIYEIVQGLAQGLVLAHRSLTEPPVLEAIHGLVHQGISAEDAVAAAGLR